MKNRRDRNDKNGMSRTPLMKKLPILTKVGTVTMLSGILMSSQTQVFASESLQSATITINAADYDNLSETDRSRIIYSSISENVNVNSAEIHYTLVYRKNGTCELKSHRKTGISLENSTSTKISGTTLPNTGSEKSLGVVILGGTLLLSVAYLVLKNKKTGKLLLIAVIGLGLTSQSVSATSILQTVASLDTTLTYAVKVGELFSFTPEGTIDCYEYVGYIPVSVTSKEVLEDVSSNQNNEQFDFVEQKVITAKGNGVFQDKKPELTLSQEVPSVELPKSDIETKVPETPRKRRKFIFSDFDERTKRYYRETGLTLPVVEFDEEGDEEPNLQDIVLETNNPVSFSEYMAKNYPSLDYSGTTKQYDDGRYFVPAWDDEGYLTLSKLELIKTEKLDENGEPFIEYRYEPIFESFVVYPE